MNDAHYYQYAFAQTDCRTQDIGPGVDPRFDVELVCCGPIAAVVSRVGLDRFDVEKFQGKTAEDISWLNQVAIRHNEIITLAAGSSPVLPLRLGTIFWSRDSLLDTMEGRRETIVDFFSTLGDRREWGVKLYLQKPHVEEADDHMSSSPSDNASAAVSGTAYLKRKSDQLRRRRELHSGLQQEIQGVEQQLKIQADRCCRVRSLPAGLTGHLEKMVFNAAYLLPPAEVKTWLATVEQIRDAVRRKGLLLEVSGPWPPYHFCPEFNL